TAAPGISAESTAETVSGRALKPSASGGTAPARTRSPLATRLPSAPTHKPVAVGTAVGGGGAVPRLKPELPEAIILRITIAANPGRAQGYRRVTKGDNLGAPVTPTAGDALLAGPAPRQRVGRG